MNFKWFIHGSRKRTKNNPFFLILALLISTSILLYAQGEGLTPKVYKIPAGGSSEIVNFIKLLIGEEGKVTLQKNLNRMIVVATKTQHTEINKLMVALNAPPRNIRIEVKVDSVSDKTNTELGVKGSGSIQITPDKTNYKYTVRPRIQHQQSTEDSLSTQFLIVTSGKEATILVGAEVPLLVAEWLVQYGQTYGYIEKEIQWREVGAKLWILPTVIGDGPAISVKLIPEISLLVGTKPERIKLTKVTTEVTGYDGQPLVIGGANLNSEFYDMFLAGFSKSSEKTKTTITLTPRILKPRKYK